MDGNRRWARQHKLPVLMGHRKVVEERIEELIEKASEMGIKVITLWAFSTENWGREQAEVEGIMQLLRWALQRKGEKLIKQGARMRVIGDLSYFPSDIQDGLRKMVEKSEVNDRITVVLALNYGGRNEIVRAVKRMIEDGNNDFDERVIADYLDTSGLPDPDLVIRTSGEIRLSGFLPWQSVYSELYFTKTLMPDFGAGELEAAITEYNQRERRFGKA